MKIRRDQIATLRQAAMAERTRRLARRLERAGIEGARELADVVIEDAERVGLRGVDDDLRVAELLVEAKAGPSFSRWRDVLVAILYNDSAPMGDRLAFLEREVMPRIAAAEDSTAPRSTAPQEQR